MRQERQKNRGWIKIPPVAARDSPSAGEEASPAPPRRSVLSMSSCRGAGRFGIALRAMRSASPVYDPLVNVGFEPAD